MVTAIAAAAGAPAPIDRVAVIAFITDHLSDADLITRRGQVVAVKQGHLPDIVFNHQGGVAVFIGVQRADFSTDRRVDGSPFSSGQIDGQMPVGFTMRPLGQDVIIIRCADFSRIGGGWLG